MFSTSSGIFLRFIFVSLTRNFAFLRLYFDVFFSFQSIFRWSVAVSTMRRQSSRIAAFLQADARPMFSWPRSASTARSQVWQGFPNPESLDIVNINKLARNLFIAGTRSIGGTLNFAPPLCRSACGWPVASPGKILCQANLIAISK